MYSISIYQTGNSFYASILTVTGWAVFTTINYPTRLLALEDAEAWLSDREDS